MARTSRPKRRSRRSGKSAGSAKADVNVQRFERLFDSIERELKQMRSSIKLFQSDPGRYKPQLENVAYSAGMVRNAANIIERSIGAK